MDKKLQSLDLNPDILTSRMTPHIMAKISEIHVSEHLCKIYHSGFLGKTNTKENLLQQFQFIRVQVNTNLLKK